MTILTKDQEMLSAVMSATEKKTTKRNETLLPQQRKTAVTALTFVLCNVQCSRVSTDKPSPGHCNVSGRDNKGRRYENVVT